MNKADLAGIISSPKKPNIMQFQFVLTEEIDCKQMYAAMPFSRACCAFLRFFAGRFK